MVRSAPSVPEWSSLIMGRRGAVVSQHALATQAGLDVLRGGGNAIDAAVAIGATLAVVEPQGSGLGGDGLFTVWSARTRQATIIQGLGRSPHAATPSAFGGSIERLGPRAAVTPALATAWAMLIERYATQPAAALFEAAVHYARDGFPVSDALRRQIVARRDQLATDPGCRQCFFVGGEPPNAGATLKNPALARSLEELAGYDGWSSSSKAVRSLIRFSRTHGGLHTEQDFEEVRATEEPPVRGSYRDHAILVAPPPSMGFALLLHLAIVQEFEMAQLAHGAASAVHLLVEAKKMAFAERELYSGDPAHDDIPIDRLLTGEHAKKLALRIDPRRPTPTPRRSRSVSGDTSYFAVVDEQGNAVSAIQSLADTFGACAMDESSGILLNNRMTWFHLDAAHPNALGPAKFARHTTNAPLALYKGDLRTAFGATAGDVQHQTAAQIATAIFDHGLAPQQAVEAPRWAHYQPGTGSTYPHDTPDVLVMESRFEPHVIEDLRRRGHNVATVGPMQDAGNAGLIWRDASGVLLCGADPRHGSWAGAF